MEQIRQAGPADLPEIRRLWEICFPAEGGFNDYFFAHIFHLPDVLLTQGDGGILSMVQEIPAALTDGRQRYPATYIYGACTHPEARGRGCMARLLQNSQFRDRERGRAASFLIPAEPGLFDFYERFGYRTRFYQSLWQETWDAAFFQPFYTLVSAGDAEAVRMAEIYNREVPGLHPLRELPDWQGQARQFAVLGGQVFLLKKEAQYVGYAFVWKEPGNLWAQEMICRSEADYSPFAQLLMRRCGEKKLKITGLPRRGAAPAAMLRKYRPFPAANGYVNLLWN